MRSIWHSLAWKEWHEHKWKLASLTVILWGVTSVSLLSFNSDEFGLALAMLLVSFVPLAVFIGLGVAADERSRNTLPFLQALPAPMGRVAVCKLVFGLVTVVVPIALTVAFLYGWSRMLVVFGDNPGGALRTLEQSPPLFDVGSWYLNALLFYGLIAGSLFIWAAATGNNCKDEVRAGAVALAVMAGWSTLLVYLANEVSLPESINAPVKVAALSTAPAGPVLVDGTLHRELQQYPAIAAWTTAITHLLLIALYIVRFGRVSNLEVRSPKVAHRRADRPDWLAPPRRSWLSAIVWKQFRESGPVVLTGLTAVIGIVALFVLPKLEQYDFEAFVHVTGAVSITLGVAVALVVGIGIFWSDLTPQINTFWRSRPIHPDGWFWTKLISGWLVLLAAFALPLLLVGSIAWWGRSDGDLRQALLFAVLTPLSLYAAAVATTSLVRHAVYGAILSIPLMYSGIALVWLVSQLGVLVREGNRPVHGLVELSNTQVALGLLLSFVASTLIAWLAVRHDWGWKSRY